MSVCLVSKTLGQEVDDKIEGIHEAFFTTKYFTSTILSTLVVTAYEAKRATRLYSPKKSSPLQKIVK